MGKKMNFIKLKLGPRLYNVTLDLRKNLRQVFVVPYLNLLPVYSYEGSIYFFFTGFGKDIDTSLIKELMGYNLENKGRHVSTFQKKSESLGWLEGGMSRFQIPTRNSPGHRSNLTM